jgi:hypothetical protein
MIETPEDLKADAIKRKFGPGTVARTFAGSEVQLTSWPWFEGEGARLHGLIMARTTVGWPNTNQQISYFSLMKFVREEPLD